MRYERERGLELDLKYFMKIMNVLYRASIKQKGIYPHETFNDDIKCKLKCEPYTTGLNEP